jgi:hypothetical protein
MWAIYATKKENIFSSKLRKLLYIWWIFIPAVFGAAIARRCRWGNCPRAGHLGKGGGAAKSDRDGHFVVETLSFRTLGFATLAFATIGLSTLGQMTLSLTALGLSTLGQQHLAKRQLSWRHLA